MRDGPDSGGRLDRARSRRERMIERETRDANRLLRKVRLLSNDYVRGVLFVCAFSTAHCAYCGGHSSAHPIQH